MMGLWACTVTMLALPRVLGVVAIAAEGRVAALRRGGGTGEGCAAGGAAVGAAGPGAHGGAQPVRGGSPHRTAAGVEVAPARGHRGDLGPGRAPLLRPLGAGAAALLAAWLGTRPADGLVAAAGGAAACCWPRRWPCSPAGPALGERAQGPRAAAHARRNWARPPCCAAPRLHLQPGPARTTTGWTW